MQDMKFKQAAAILDQESGFVLITALMFMVILTIMGVASMSIRNTEQSITKNAEVFQNNFYSVEAATLEGANSIAVMADTILKDPAAFPGWLKTDDPTNIDLSQETQWPSGFILPTDTTLNAGITSITPPGYAPGVATGGDRIAYAAIDLGPCGGSLTDPTQVEKCYDVYGMYDVTPGPGKAFHGKMMLAVGYKRVVYLD